MRKISIFVVFPLLYMLSFIIGTNTKGKLLERAGLPVEIQDPSIPSFGGERGSKATGLHVAGSAT